MTAPPALILGAAVWAEGPSPTLRRRARHGAALWHRGRAGRLIACGGLGRHPPTEAEAIGQILRAEGVPEAAIALEPRSRNTRENIAFALPLLDGPAVILVTDRWHGPRARLIARRLGLAPQSACPPLRGTSAVGQARMALREALALPVDWLRFRPTHRGPGAVGRD